MADIAATVVTVIAYSSRFSFKPGVRILPGIYDNGTFKPVYC